jgi:hypothetical protein
MENTDPHKVNDESLRAQLIQLNERSRWYSSQAWQIPFAFLSLVVIAVETTMDKSRITGGSVFLVLFFIGLFVIWHMISVAKGAERAVVSLKKIERELFFQQTTVKQTHTWLPFFVSICVATVACLIVAGILLLNP